MRAVSCLAAFALLGLLLNLPVLGADDKDKKDDPPKNDAKKADGKKDDSAAAEKKKMRASSLSATVVRIVEGKKALRLKVKVPYVKASGSKLQYATKDQEVEWAVMDDAKVRLRNPPPQFDDKGRAKRYTPKELKELRGNEKLPGYPADFSDLKAGQTVQVTVLQKKTASRAPRRAKGAEGEWADGNLPKISLIVILAEPKN